MKLSQRILILVLSTTLLLGLLNLFISKYQDKNLYRDSENILVQSISQILSDTLVQDVISGNKLRITDILRKLHDNENSIEFIYITNVDRSIFAHSFKQGFPRYLTIKHDRKKLRKSDSTLEGKYLTENGLIYVYEARLIPGLDISIHIGINQTEITNKLGENVQGRLLLNVIAILLAMLIGYIWSRQLTKPLANFTEQVQRFGAGGTFDLSEFKKSNKELQLLADVFKIATFERQQALSRLQEREQDLAVTLNSIGDAVIATDKDGNVTRMNPVAEELTGWTLEEARGESIKTIFPIVNATTRKDIDNPVEKVLARGETVHLSNHTTLLSKDGTEYQIADSAAPIRNRDNEIQGMVLIFNDVTEQYHMREEIRSSEQHLKLYRDQTPLASIEWNTDFQVMDWNPAAEKMFGYTLDEVKGRDFVDIMLPESAVVDVKQIWADLMSQSGGEISINENLTKGGDIILCEWHNTALRDESGTVIGAASMVQDITERQQQEEQLRRSQKMDALGKLTGGIAHDYNNMLGIILGYAEVLDGAIKDQPELAGYVHEIRHAGERGAQLTKKLLNFSRHKIGEETKIDINTLLRDGQQMLEKTLTARINVVLNLADDLWPVWMNGSDLEDAIINMSINAMHAIEGSGQLTIQTTNTRVDDKDAKFFELTAGDYVLLSVTDTGCGMDKITTERLFDPFYSTKGERGTGLGLSQVYGFVERSIGAIKVYSEQGHGSRFMLYFPRYDDDEKECGVVEERKPGDLTGGETILVVDDEPVLLKLASEVLSRNGYHVICAESAKQALALLETESVDLMISDIIMPEMNGYQLASSVREKYPNVKIQLASGFADDRDIDEVSKDLQRNLLYKPYDIQNLLSKVRGLLD